jgi:hypothetical protein
VSLYLNANPAGRVEAMNIIGESGASPYVKRGLPVGTYAIWGSAQDNLDNSWKTCTNGAVTVVPSDDVVSASSDHNVDGQQRVCLDYSNGQWFDDWVSNDFYCANDFDFTVGTRSAGTMSPTFGHGGGCIKIRSDSRYGLGGNWSGVTGANPSVRRTGCQSGCRGRDPTVLDIVRPWGGSVVCVKVDDGAVGNQPGAVSIHIDWGLTR